jgi:hypothetical protein
VTKIEAIDSPKKNYFKSMSSEENLTSKLSVDSDLN